METGNWRKLEDGKRKLEIHGKWKPETGRVD
jgi:hypothetical protein